MFHLVDGYETVAQPELGRGMRTRSLAHVSLAVLTEVCDAGAVWTVCNGDMVEPEHAVSEPGSNKPTAIYAGTILRFNLQPSAFRTRKIFCNDMPEIVHPRLNRVEMECA